MEKYKLDFQKPYNIANEILLTSKSIKSFPYSVKDLIQEISDIRCCSYEKALKYKNLNIEDFGSKSAIIIKQSGRKIIFYNQSECTERIRFSILHEYGHEKLNHNFNIKEDNEYKKYEIEANYLSAQLLMPEQLIREVQRRGKRISKEILISIFGVSAEAAEKRMETLKKCSYRTQEEKQYDDLILEKYMSWLNMTVPQNNYYNMLDYDEEMESKRSKWM